METPRNSTLIYCAPLWGCFSGAFCATLSKVRVGAMSSDNLAQGWWWEGREQNQNIFIRLWYFSAGFCKCLQGHVLSSLIPGPPMGASHCCFSNYFSSTFYTVCRTAQTYVSRVFRLWNPLIWRRAAETSLRLLASTFTLCLLQPLTRRCLPQAPTSAPWGTFSEA